MFDLPTTYQSFIHKSRYARWNDKTGRRESWEETVDRYLDFMCDYQCAERGDDDKPETWKSKISTAQKAELREAILKLKIMPSMRCLHAAGEALKRDNIAGFNCSYVTVDRPRAFDETLYILMCGTGVGFSVERQYVNELPMVPEELFDTDTTIIVRDSRTGWAKSYREMIGLLFAGQIPKWDVSKVRPAGARLKTFGGRASGPAPLVDLFKFTVAVFKTAKGRKLTSIECHDLMCKIAEIVVVGGVRRSALLGLSNLSDDRMRLAKSGQWWEQNPQRALANNSVCYTEKPDIGIFMKEWLSLYDSKSGERGIFNRVAAQKQAAKYGRRDPTINYGCNPCSEILLRPNQFCNLAEVIVRAEDTFESLKEKVRLATIVGTMQATLTDFRYLGSEWTKNTKEEALLGVSLTGILDNKLMAGREDKEKLKTVLNSLREYAIEVNKEWAEKLGIEPSAAITCVKPSGTVSQLVDAASGIHARHSPYYIRTVRADIKDPLATTLIAQGFPYEKCVNRPEHVLIFSFPVKSPEGAIYRTDLSANEHLELWMLYQDYWCEHKPSITIYVKEPEWMEIGAWVYKNFNKISGVSFLPHSEHTYKQAPYQDCTKEEYEALLAKMPKEIDWELLKAYESDDNTIGSQTGACSSGNCEITDISTERK